MDVHVLLVACGMDTTAAWLQHFQRNRQNLLRLEHSAHRLTDEERTRIARSVQSFQIGEASEGRRLRALAERYGRHVDDPHYAEVIGLLIREENRHSAYLKHFMDAEGIPLARSRVTDRVFRWLRGLCGLELAIRVLVTAELVALTYYAALARATAHVGLARICARMLEEERIHVQFQMQQIHIMNTHKSRLIRAMADHGHALLLAATLVAVWIEHRSVLRVCHSFEGFFAAVWRDFRAAMDRGRSAASGAVAEPRGSPQRTRA